MPSGKNFLFLEFFVNLASILLDKADNEELKKKIISLIEEHKCYRFPDEQVEKAIHANDAAHLFLMYKDEPSNVKNFNFIENLQRKIWLYNVCANYYKTLTFDDLQKTVRKKFDDEKSFNKELNSTFYCLFNEAKRYKNDEFLFKLGRFYSQYINYFEEAYSKFESFFEPYENKTYLKFIYNSNTAKEDPIISPKQQIVADSNEEKENPFLSMDEIEKLVSENEQLSNIVSKLENDCKLLEDINETLNREKHNLEVKNNYTKKDTIRDLIVALNNQSRNSPLGELYYESLRDDLDKKTKGIITNLFSSLGDMGIKLVKEKEVGKEIIITNENQRSYDPAKNEQIFLGDNVVVVYPGYRYENETMVRPIIKKVKESYDGNRKE